MKVAATAQTYLLLADADFVLQSRRSVLRRSSVLVRGDRIAEVGDAREISERHPTAEWIDCRGWLLHPGLVNAHNHLYQVLLRGLGKNLDLWQWLKHVTYPIAAQLKEEDYRTSALLACVDAIRNGTTAIVDMPTHFARHHADATIAAIRDSGLRGAVARGLADRREIGDEGDHLNVEIEAGERFLSSWSGQGLVKPWLGPSGFHSSSPRLLKEAKALATSYGARLHVHLAETRSSLGRAAEAGHEGEVSWADDLGLLDAETLVAHAVWTSTAEWHALARTDAQVVHNPTSNQLLAVGAAPVTRMRAAGVTVALGTDGPASNDAMDLYGEMKAAVLLQRVTTLDVTSLSALEAFEMCTEGGAGALGMERLGRLQPGYLADVVAVQVHDNPRLTPMHNPIESLVFQACGRDVVLTMVGGKVLYRDGQVTTIDDATVMRDVRRIQNRIARQHPGLITATLAVHVAEEDS